MENNLGEIFEKMYIKLKIILEMSLIQIVHNHYNNHSEVINMVVNNNNNKSSCNQRHPNKKK